MLEIEGVSERRLVFSSLSAGGASSRDGEGGYLTDEVISGVRLHRSVLIFWGVAQAPETRASASARTWNLQEAAHTRQMDILE